MFTGGLKLLKHSTFFNRNGYVVLKNVLSKETKDILKTYVKEIEYKKECSKYLHQFEKDANDNQVICRTEYIVNNHKGMNNLITTGFIPEIVSKIYNKPIILFKEKINYKYPNTGGYNAHQDVTAYPGSHNHITCMINLCDTNEKNGGLSFSPLITNGYHSRSILQNKKGIIEDADNLKWINCPTEFGDIVLFNSYIPHKSNPNLTNFPRKSLYITYNDAKEGDLREKYYQNKKKHMQDGQISLIDHYNGNIVKKKSESHIFVSSIIDLYKEKGHLKYDSHVTHLEHALHTTEMAKQNNENEKFQLSCFLHDIGHLLLDEHNNKSDFLLDNLNHERIGYDYIRPIFGKEISQPVLFHVLAKRYLCSVDKEYFDKLSEASKKSFYLQGGYLNLSKINKTQAFDDAVKMRRYEDISKIKYSSDSSVSVTLDYVEKLMNQYVIRL
jgi:predicted HD phosphohydrolase